MQKYTVLYTIDGEGPYEHETEWELDMSNLEYIAEEIAEADCENSGGEGWGYNDKHTIILMDGEEILGEFEVEGEAVMQFYATRKD